MYVEENQLAKDMAQRPIPRSQNLLPKQPPKFQVQQARLHEHPSKITIDMSKAHIWDQSGVIALEQIVRKLSVGGSNVEVIGLNQESLDLFERLGGQDPLHS